jgi:hypothetical protein
MLDDLERVLNDGTSAERQAAALALADSPAERADALLAARPDLRDAVQSGALTWDRLARDVADAAA